LSQNQSKAIACPLKPIIMNHKKNFSSPLYLFNGHLQSIYPSLFRKVKEVSYERERIFTTDGDFLDLDWSSTNSPSIAIVSHGLEGSSDSKYVKGVTRLLNQNGWDVLAWNFRSCSGELNWKLRSYHSGATEDLDFVVQHAFKRKPYQKVALIGFSLGGNLTLKYAGEQSSDLDPRIQKVIAVSAPCDLAASSAYISTGFSRVYEKRFLNTLVPKAIEKSRKFGYPIKENITKNLRTIWAFDDLFTAPIHGFRDASDYYRQCSANRFIPSIEVSTLILSAWNDPFLADECYPFALTQKHPYVTLDVTKEGGHVGFFDGNTKVYWSEQRMLRFLAH